MLISNCEAKKLKNIYCKVTWQIKQSIAQYPVAQSIEGIQSRDNLLTFIALQNHNLDQWDLWLKEYGLASFADARAHTLFTIKKVLRQLGINYEFDSSLSVPSPSEASMILQSRASRVLGNSTDQRKAKIMVTLDAKMVHDTQLLEDFLVNGMDIVRINCAHGDSEIWKELILTLRNAEVNLKAKGKWKGSTCKIYMDLGGPKIRIGSFNHSEKLLTVKTPVDSNGKFTGTIEGFVDSGAAETTVDIHSFTIAVKEQSSLELLKIGDKLTFWDLNNQKRTLRVIDILSKTCIKVQLDYTALIGASTVFIHEKGIYHIRSMPYGPVEIRLTKGDKLRLYLDEKRLGHAASDNQIAGVPVTLKKAFQNVRPADRVFIDDGKIAGIVQRVGKEYIDLMILSPVDEYVNVKEGKGVNLPDSLLSISVPALTDKDLMDLPFIASHADMVGISFVHSPNDLKMLRTKLEQLSASHLPVIAKIETKDAIHHLGRILIEGLNFNGFGVMIARGDLAIEVGYEQLSSAQEQIFNLCSAAHIPVIWATGVLESLTKKGIPSRAEITDAAYGAKANAIMLNKGKYVSESIQLLNHILTDESPPFMERKSRTTLFPQLGLFKFNSASPYN
ncbi:pyruvate kinase [Siminovitchia acidinfaciens]|nr:pyruvate kinase [Siminovitchia acidinfaciens]